VSRIREAFTVEMPLRSLFETPTIAGLAAQVDMQLKSGHGLEAPALVKASREGELPLSFAQQRLWFLDQLEPNGASYNIPAAVRLTGQLNVDALEQSISEIIRRHEVLRTSFTVVDGQPRQVISPAGPFTLSVTELTHLAEAEREAEAQRLATTEAKRPFDLSRGPLLRVSLLRLGAEEHVLLVTMHHIISDGWSLGIFTREVGQLYEAFCGGESSPLAELAVQYGDYAVWQRGWLQGEALEEQLGYWKRQLEGAPPLTELPLDRPRPDAQSYRGASQSFTFSEQLTKELKELGQQQGVTLFMTMLAAFQTLLYRYTGQEDLVVGADIANRTRVETESLIGLFINLLVMRTAGVSGNLSFNDLLRRVRDVTLGAYAHQEVPFEKLVEELQPGRNLSYNPLVQVVLSVQNAPAERFELPGLTLSLADNGAVTTTKWDLALFVWETGEGLSGGWKYNTDLFDEATIKRMSGHLLTLLESVIADPTASLSKLEMLTRQERAQREQEKTSRKKARFSKFKNIDPEADSVAQEQLVKTGYLRPGETLPLVIRPAIADVDIVEWARNERDFIQSHWRRDGAILFRGCDLNSASDFERLATAVCPELFGEYGDLPREGAGGKVYGSTPYPSDQAILFHNESSHMHRWPLNIFFYCVEAAEEGGETPLVDCRKIYARLDPKIRERFAEKRLMYVRNFTEGLDVSWQSFFQTTSRETVEKYCREASIDVEWKQGGGLRARQVRRAVARHPKTSEMLFFNQILLHHVACLEPSVRESMLSLFSEEEMPRNVYYGDGSPIETSIVEEIRELYWDVAVKFRWQKGDCLIADNMLVAHARMPFAGPRKILVAMGEMISDADCGE
ncbi:MAG: condensation domain-containing protein, partial [Pyrinomonadaceae bacterium]